MKNITVIGVGKLGLCFALTLEKNGYNVIGVDIDQGYVESLNNKKFNSDEPKVTSFLKNSTQFAGTTEMKKGIRHSDILFLFVSTPSLKNGKYDHSQIDKVSEQLIDLNDGIGTKYLIIGCTTMPGYCDSLQKKLNPYGYIVSYNPEFIAQGSIMNDMSNPDLLLIGESNRKAGDLVESIYSSFLNNNPTIHRMKRKEAEITKIALNCFLTTKIAYANMVGDIAKQANCDPNIILNAIGSDSRIGKKYLKYGYGFGGPCFPRDNRAFYNFADDIGINAIMSKATRRSNKEHLQNQIKDFIRNNDKSKIIKFSNITYKPGTNIIEESQKLQLAVELAKIGYKIVVHDKKVIIDKVKDRYKNLFVYKVKKV